MAFTTRTLPDEDDDQFRRRETALVPTGRQDGPGTAQQDDGHEGDDRGHHLGRFQMPGAMARAPREDLVHQQAGDHAATMKAAMGHQRCTIRADLDRRTRLPESKRIAARRSCAPAPRCRSATPPRQANNTPITPHPGRAAFEMDRAVSGPIVSADSSRFRSNDRAGGGRSGGFANAGGPDRSSESRRVVGFGAPASAEGGSTSSR